MDGLVSYRHHPIWTPTTFRQKCDWNCNSQIRVWTTNLKFFNFDVFFEWYMFPLSNPGRFLGFSPEVSNFWRFPGFTKPNVKTSTMPNALTIMRQIRALQPFSSVFPFLFLFGCRNLWRVMAHGWFFFCLWNKPSWNKWKSQNLLKWESNFK